MRPVRTVCELQPGALTMKLSDQIEQLDALIEAEGDGTAFYERTYVTQGMNDLISEGLARLASISSQAVFHLKQAMGGGKTHLLVGFGLVAKHPSLRRRYFSHLSYRNAFNHARIAAFNGRNNPDHFFWGAVAEQLGKGEMFKSFWASGPKAPDETDWLTLLDGPDPVLILLDEMPPYFHYLDTQRIGNGTVADIATRAFANLLTAAGKKSNVCVVVSDLTAAYDTGTRLINRALEDARSELGRQERNITPVDLASDEIYNILRKRLFLFVPNDSEIAEVAEAFGLSLREAVRSHTANRGAEAIADEIASTYPFHPRLKGVIALFKENEQFKQTRGLIELVSRLLRSVWERPENDVFLIGPQHFDLSIPEVRDKLTEISGMREVIAKDLWDGQHSAHTQLIDLQLGSNLTAQVGSLLLTASLSTAVNAIKGLTREDMVECLVTPSTAPSDYLSVFDQLDKLAWYLHHTPEGRYYFDRQENLTKLLQNLANHAPSNQVDELIRKRLEDMFRPARKAAYENVLPLPKLQDVADRVRKGRVLLIVSPDAKIPPEEVQEFFEGITQKNNLCILTGDKTAMGNVEQAARHVFAAKKADNHIPPGHPQRPDLEQKQQVYEQDFNATVLGLFDKVLFPRQRRSGKAELIAKALDMTRDQSKAFNGEEQIEKTLTSDPLKLYLDVEKDFEAILEKAESLLWPESQDEARWVDIVDRYAEQAGMPWLPPKGLDTIKSMASNRGRWEDLSNGYVTKSPTKKKTSVQVIPETVPDDNGVVRLRINSQNAGPAPRIYYAEDGEVSEASPQLKDPILKTQALRVNFLVVDPTEQFETGDAVLWQNKLVIRNRLSEEAGQRQVELFVAPRGDIYYTLDGSEPRLGLAYSGAIAISQEETLLRVLASAEGLEAKSEFRFPASGKREIPIDFVKSARLVSSSGYRLDSRAKTFEGLTEALGRSVVFNGVTLTVGQGSKIFNVIIGDVDIDSIFLQGLLTMILKPLDAEVPVNMSFRQARFASGHDLKTFADKLGILLQPGGVEQ